MSFDTIEEYFSGQGKVYYAERSSLGRPNADGFVFLGDCSALKVKMTVEQKKHMEHQTGKNSVDNVFETTLSSEIEMSLDEIRQEALKLYIYGSAQDKASVTVTAETVVAKLGRSVPLANMVQTFTSLTNIGGATVYTQGTGYDVSDTGMISFPLTGTSITDGQSLRANYVSKAEQVTTGLTASNKNIYLRFDGLNRAKDDAPVVIEIYKARFSPADVLDIINDDYAKYDLKGMALYDKLNAGDAAYGGFMRIRLT